MSYPTEVAPAGAGGRVSAVEPSGPASRAGIVVGDVIVSAAGEPVRDVIDWMWLADDAEVEAVVLGPDGTRRDVTLSRDLDEGWGFDYEGVVFDGIRECDNACTFCFVAQLPPGLRPALYVRDDDFRLSFLAGNFITLTNLSDDDIHRILEQRLSPLHVSVHAVDPDVRRRLLCATAEDRALEFIDTLLAGGIEIHTQIVLVPGVNDGDVLERTLAWLAERPRIASVGVVPVGLTRFSRLTGQGYRTADSAAAVIAQLAPWQARMREARGISWIMAADEFYLTAHAPLPAWDDYDGFPQFENGIGMTRAFADEMAEHSERLEGTIARACGVVLVTGELFGPVLEALARTLSEGRCSVRVLPVRNEMLGGEVTVAGLLGGTDLEAAIRADVRARAGAGPGASDVYLLPDVVLNDDGVTLDGHDLTRIGEAAGADVRLVSCDAAGLVTAFLAVSSPQSG
jgi:putative radical SAM enzyme (TIGR03279 family)